MISPAAGDEGLPGTEAGAAGAAGSPASSPLFS